MSLPQKHTIMITVITPEHIQYNNGILCLTVLGGIRLDNLDRLRVTLKIALPDNPRPPLRHNLDLYNDTQVEKLVRKTAERMEIGAEHYTIEEAVRSMSIYCKVSIVR